MLVAGTLAAFATLATAAQGHSNVRIGIGIGFPVYPRPIYAAPYYPYYRPYPVYVAPPPVYYAPPPVVVQQAPVVYQAAPTPVPTVNPVVSNTGSYQQPPAMQRVAEVSNPESGRYIQQLFDQQERVRADAAMELGRMKAAQALDPLCTLLSTDRSPVVRETAARALGLIADARALSALQNAAQSDSDRDVRRSAQFAVEVIRANQR